MRLYVDGMGVTYFFFSSRRRHTRYWRDWSSDVCSSDLMVAPSSWYAAAVSNPAPDWVPPVTRSVPMVSAVVTTSVPPAVTDRKSVVLGKSVDLGGRRII